MGAPRRICVVYISLISLLLLAGWLRISIEIVIPFLLLLGYFISTPYQSFANSGSALCWIGRQSRSTIADCTGRCLGGYICRVGVRIGSFTVVTYLKVASWPLCSYLETEISDIEA